MKHRAGPMRVHSFGGHIETAKRAIIDDEIASRKRQRIAPVGRNYIEKGGGARALVVAAKSAALDGLGECGGDRNRARLYAALAHIDSLDFPRSHHQRRFHECFICASLRTIYGDDYQVHTHTHNRKRNGGGGGGWNRPGLTPAPHAARCARSAC